jgi:ATP-dependent 26S proteasome regulatory subunit
MLIVPEMTMFPPSFPRAPNASLNVLLTEMSSEDNDNIFMIFATNYMELLDGAFLRSGRCDIKIEVPLPDVETRLQILELNTRRKPLGEDVELRTIAEMMEGNNCADVSLLVNQTARTALKKDKMEINQEDFVEALEKMNVKKEVEKVKKIGFELNK